MNFSIAFKDKVVNRVLRYQSVNFKNKDVTLLCNNCVGGVILHDLKLKFNTPTINLYFHASDFVSFLEKLDFYLNQEIYFSNVSKFEPGIKLYPVGRIADIEMHFVHYEGIKDAKEKWEERKKRINFENIFVIGSDNGNCTPEIIDRFLKLPYKNKIFFSSKKLPFKEVIFFKENSKKTEVGDLINQDNAWYFYFDTVKWLNTGEIKRYKIIRVLFEFYRMIRRKYQKINRSQEKYERYIRQS